MATPKPKPTQMKIIEGNPSRRPLPKNEPEPDVSVKVPKPPKYLSKTAKKEWKVIAERLHRLGLLTEIDLSALAIYCQAYGRSVDAENELQKSTMIITTDKGNDIQNPLIGIINRSAEIAHKFLTEFGMTPSSRTKVSAAKAEKKSKFYGLISGGSKNDKQKQG